LILAVGGLSHSRYPVFAGDSSKKPAKPNVIVILADDLGFADLSISGNREVATPQIDSVAKNGVRCTNGYVSCPVCSPTRAGFLTGRYQQRFGHEFNPALLKNDGQGQGLPVEEPTIADRLHAAGYATSLIGKWHQGEEEQFHPLKRGFDEFFGFPLGWHSFFPSDDPEFGPMYRGRERVEVNSYLTRVLAAEACSTIERNRQRPFFIYLAFNAVHTPMEAPPETLGRFSGIDDVNRRTYLAMLAELDAGVGSVLDKLRTLGLEEQTLVFFLSDNGGPTTKFSPNGARNTPLRGSKGDTWEGGIHVPFFVQWKGKLPAGAVYEQPVISLDVSATALAAAGIAPPEKPALDGVNLLPYLAGTSAAPPHEYLFWRFGQQMAVRSGDWKLVRPSLGKGDYESVATTPLLFNLKDDLGEQHDLLAQQPEKARQLQAAWDAWNEQLPAPRWPATLKGKKFYTGP
jgi:arylsulfatase A-like enzyme